jgi:hypothetical protein
MAAGEETGTSWSRLLVQGLFTAGATALIMLHAFGLEVSDGPGLPPLVPYFVAYAITTTFLLGATLGYVLQRWVAAERRAFARERRQHPRVPRRLRCDWRTGRGGSRAVTARDISQTGVAVSRLDDDVGAVGIVDIPGRGAHRAEVVRHEGDRITGLRLLSPAPSDDTRGEPRAA